MQSWFSKRPEIIGEKVVKELYLPLTSMLLRNSRINEINFFTISEGSHNSSVFVLPQILSAFRDIISDKRHKTAPTYVTSLSFERLSIKLTEDD